MIIARECARGIDRFAPMSVRLEPIIESRAQRQSEVVGERLLVQREESREGLPAAGEALARVGAVSERKIFLRLAAHGAGIETERGFRVPRVRPCAGPSGAVGAGRHGKLVARGRLGGARGVDGAERAGETTALGVRARVPRKSGRHRTAQAHGGEVAARAVALIRRAVVSRFLEGAGGHDRFEIFAEARAGADVERAMIARRGFVDRTSALGRDEVEAGRGERLAKELDGARAKRAGEAERSAARGEGTGAGAERGVICVERRAEELDNASEGGVAPSRRAAAAHDLGAGNTFARQLTPEHPAAEGIIERHAIQQHERTTRAAWAEAPERNALRGRIGGKTIAATKQAKSRHRAQGAIKRGGGRGEQFGAGEDARGKRDAIKRLRRAAGRHDQGR